MHRSRRKRPPFLRSMSSQMTSEYVPLRRTCDIQVADSNYSVRERTQPKADTSRDPWPLEHVNGGPGVGKYLPFSPFTSTKAKVQILGTRGEDRKRNPILR